MSQKNNAINSPDPIDVSSGGTGQAVLTQDAVLCGNGTGNVFPVGPGTDGQLLIAATGAFPDFADLTSTGGTITITPGANTLNIETGAAVAASFPTDAGTAVPAAGALTIAGGSNLNTTGAAAVVTVNLDSTVSISGSFTAGTTITATAGDITATAGDFVATVGSLYLSASNIQTSLGSIIQSGNPLLHTSAGGGGGNNLFVGADGGSNIAGGTTGESNTSLGSQALLTVGNGVENTAAGHLALTLVDTGSYNTAVGQRSGDALVDGSRNVSVGHLSLSASVSDASNTAVGAECMISANGSPQNTAVGYQALSALNGGAGRNVAIGYQAMLSATQAEHTIAIGDNAGTNLTTGTHNIAMGQQALFTTTTGTQNIAIGQLALSFNQGSSNTVVGGGAVTSLATGNSNIVIGAGEGNNYTTNESYNILIGANATEVAGEDNTIRIGGGTGGGAGQQNQCFISGIDGVNVGSVATVVTEASNKLGTAVITAGAGITVTPGANLITIAQTGTVSLTYTNVNSTPYVVQATDQYLSVDCSGGAITLQFPNAATSGKTFVVKDRTGSANSFPITVTTVGGAVNIDGATSYSMNTQYAAIQLIGNGSTYELF